MAAPIRSSNAVIGILEVFSPQPGAFTEADRVGLQRLAEIVLGAVHRAIQAMATTGHLETAPLPDVVLPPLADTPPQAALPGKILAGRKLYIVAIAAAILLLSAIVMVPRIWNAPRVPPAERRPALPVSEPAGITATLPAAAPAQPLEDLRRTALQGDAMAQFNMGARYALGDDVKLDYTEAARWFTLAAEQGHVVAQSNLGAYYWSGTGVPKNLTKAYFWMLLAQTGGDESSRARISFVASRMSRMEILTVQQQVTDWLRKNHYLGQAPNDSRFEADNR
jgi:hypothetical protein